MISRQKNESLLRQEREDNVTFCEDEDLQGAVKNIMGHGPSRVLVEPDYAVPPQKARTEYDTTGDIIFIRKDGWSLAAPTRLEKNAYDMWPDEWMGFLRKPSTVVQPISEYL